MPRSFQPTLFACLLAGLVASSAAAQVNWCLESEAGDDGILGTADDRIHCNNNNHGNPRTECAVSVADQWTYGSYSDCDDCHYTLYLPVQCPGSVVLWTTANTMEVSVDALVGAAWTPLMLEASNVCERERAAGGPGPIHCDACGTASPTQALKRLESTTLEKPAGTCESALYGLLPELPCLAYREVAELVSWGTPLDAADPDTDGSGFIEGPEMDLVPCLTCYEPPGCECGNNNDNNRLVSGGLRTVEVLDVPAPTVLRISLHGSDWVYANVATCGLEEGTLLPLYAYQADAEAILDSNPAPRLELDPDPTLGFSLVSALGCPDSARVRVTTCNSGNAVAAVAPFRITDLDGSGLIFDGDQTAHPSDPACQGPLLPGECRTCEWDVALSPTRLPETEIEIHLDPDDLLSECDEASIPGTCVAVRRQASFAPCRLPACGAEAFLTAEAERVCAGDAFEVDASATVPGSCAGTMLYTFTTAALGVIPGGESGPAPIRMLTPDTPGDLGLRVHAECDVDPSCRTSSAVLPLVAGPLVPLDFPSAVAVSREGECALRVSWSEPASGEGPFSYELYRSDVSPVPIDAAHLVTSGLTETSFLDLGWNGAVSYRVVAVADCDSAANGGGDSVAITPLDDTVPSFGGVTDTRDLGFCEVEVLWDESTASDSCSGVASYNVYRDHGVGHRGDTLVASGVPGSPHVDTTPGNGTWVYVVRAVDAAGNEEQNEVFQQESENSCTNDFPADAGMDDENGVDPPSADGQAGLPWPGEGEPVVLGMRRRDGAADMRISWAASPDEGGLYLVTYSVLRGSIAALAEGRYDHALAAPDACGIALNEALLSDQPEGSQYFLVVAVAGDNATFGYDSAGAERPSAEVCYLP